MQSGYRQKNYFIVFNFNIKIGSNVAESYLGFWAHPRRQYIESTLCSLLQRKPKFALFSKT